MQSVPKYGRIQITVPDGCKTVSVTRPDGVKETALPFRCQNTRFVYDKHGFERQEIDGGAFTCFRYTPVIEGVHRFSAQGEGGVIGGIFECTPSDLSGYVEISGRDRRYFATSDGHAFVPVGPNLCILRPEHCPASDAHFAIGNGTAWMGLTSFRRWIRRLAENKVNYVRLWLSTPYFDARTSLMGRHDLTVFNRLDAVMDLLRENGIRVKMCLEHFRTLCDAPKGVFEKRVIDPDTGKALTSMQEWLDNERWNDRWIEDILPYIARYQNDPAVAAWELWNEFNCVDAPRASILAFNERMLNKVRAFSPRNLVVNSLGSYDREEFLGDYMIPFRDSSAMPFMQIHRYLDQGAPLEICGGDPVDFVADAFERIACAEKPCVLNETGAVNDRHIGPFRFYPCDDDGLIFTDLTYAPFFCGSASSGHMWHWEYYIEPKNLWTMFKPFHDMLEDIEADAEHFVPGRMDTDSAHVLTLTGKKHDLYYVRSRAASWQAVLRDGITPAPVHGLRLPVNGRVTVYWLMNERHETAPEIRDGSVTLPDFSRGCVVRVDKD